MVPTRETTPLARSMHIIYAAIYQGRIHYSNTLAEVSSWLGGDPSAYIGQRYFLHYYPIQYRDFYPVAVYRIAQSNGGFIYTIGYKPPGEALLLGYASRDKLEGMSELYLPTGAIGDPDTRNKGYRDYVGGRVYTYAIPLWRYQGDYPDHETESQFDGFVHQPIDTVTATGANSTFQFEADRHGVHIGSIKVTIPSIDVEDQEILNTPGYGRGLIQRVQFSSYNGWDGGDNFPCVTIHDCNMAGSNQIGQRFWGGGVGPSHLDRAREQSSPNVLLEYESDVNYMKMVVLPGNDGQFGNRGATHDEVPTGPAPCITQHVGERTDTPDRVALYTEMKQSIELDCNFQGREGVHRIIFGIYTPDGILAEATTADVAELHWDMPLHTMLEVEEMFYYDPELHTNPVQGSTWSFTNPLSAGAKFNGDPCDPPDPGGGIPNAYYPGVVKDPYGIVASNDGIATLRGRRHSGALNCDQCLANTSHTASGGDFTHPDPTVPYFGNGHASAWLRFASVGGMSLGDKLCLGYAAKLFNAPGSTNSLNLFSMDDAQNNCDEDPPLFGSRTASRVYTAMRFTVSLPGSGLNPSLLQAGWFYNTTFLVIDKHDNMKSHMDWLHSNGHI